MRLATVAALVVGAVGIGLLWAGGVRFPVAVPPGIVILLVGAAFVARAPWRWVPAVGVLLGAFITIGFLISPTGISNLTGDAGATVMAGQAVQLVSVVGAIVFGILATRAEFIPVRRQRSPAHECRRPANGARVLLTGRSPAALDATADAIRADGGTAAGIVADGTDPAAVERVRDRAVNEFGRVDVLAAFVGTGRARPGLLHETSLDDFRSTVDGNLTATFLALAAFLPGMVEQGSGVVVTMSSVAARRPATGAPVPYSAAKSGVEALTIEVAAQYGRYGVRANCVAPSTVLTERTERAMPQEFRDRVTAQHALGRLGMPAGVANAVAFLASNASSWITGLVIDVAGGR